MHLHKRITLDNRKKKEMISVVITLPIYFQHEGLDPKVPDYIYSQTGTRTLIKYSYCAIYVCPKILD